jgi:hypothetical protein
MAIIGDGFVDYVQKQIKIRQQALGEYNRNIKNTEAFMTRTPWVRMVSSIDLTEGDPTFPGNSVLSTIKSSGNYNGINLSGDNLAKKFILFNGISNQQGGITNLYSGITGGPSTNTFGGAYGFGSRDDIQTERGFIPMPGVTNVNFQYRNDGALAMATVQIKAFNRSQFQLIDILFQRPGYTVLLEFGSTVYLDNNGNLREANYDTLPFQHIFKTDQNMFTLHEVIAKEKAKWNGNYEGFFAKISKWNWKFNPDGSYDITINLIGMGDVINSLKINVAIDKKIEQKIEENTNNPVITSAKKSRLNSALYDIYQGVKNLPPNSIYNVKLFNHVSFEKDKDSGIVTKVNPPAPFQINFGALSISDVILDEESEYKPQTYITLGTLLALITSQLSISGKNGEENITPYILFDINLNDYSLDDNYIATFPGNFSSDPNICLIPYQPVSPDIISGLNIPNTSVNDILKTRNFFSVDNKPLIGRMINIFINIGFIIKTFENSINEDNEVILIDFLRNILNGINSSLGGLNDFRIIHNNDTNLFEIRSEVNLDIETKSPSIINTFGVVKGEGSFVREIDLNSELTDKYATMVSIGAQADGNISQNNSTAFSIYNKGLVDRVIKEKVDTARTDSKDESKIEDLFTSDIITCFSDIYESKKFTSSNILILQNINSQYCKLASGKLTQLKKSKSPFFLPFNLGLTMDGLSGMKIYQSFQVDGKVLPLTYNSKDIQLIIKSLSHDVSPEGWLTKVETIAGPIFETISSLTPGTYSESGQIETPATNPELANTSTPTNITPGVDPAPLINPKRIGAISYINSPLAKAQIANGGTNARLLYKLPYLVPMPGAPGRYLHPTAARQWELWRNELIRLGISFRVSSAYRNFAEQQALSGPRAAPAGSSPHGWGGAIDFGNLYQLVDGSPNPKINLDARKKYKMYEQIASVGTKYGWYNPWRLSDVSGKQDEIWHFEYWGSV